MPVDAQTWARATQERRSAAAALLTFTHASLAGGVLRLATNGRRIATDPETGPVYGVVSRGQTWRYARLTQVLDTKGTPKLTLRLAATSRSHVTTVLGLTGTRALLLYELVWLDSPDLVRESWSGIQMGDATVARRQISINWEIDIGQREPACGLKCSPYAFPSAYEDLGEAG